MFFVGLGVVMVCVFGGYIAMGGNIMIIIKAAPLEFVIIGGSAIGAFIIGTPKAILSKAGEAFSHMLKGPPYDKESYLELISLLYQVFKLAKSKGMLAIEPHVENPKESSIFKEFPKVMADHHVVEFLCDYLRMMTMGSDNPHQMEDVMLEELEVHHEERHARCAAFQSMADAFPALGIVAAVLGVIKTMASIDQPPEILGKMIGGALVGTFLGIFLAYGIAGPMASSMTAVYAEEGKFYQCIKVAMIAYLNGYAPAVALEFARKTIPVHVRPSFYDVEEKVSNLPAAG